MEDTPFSAGCVNSGSVSVNVALSGDFLWQGNQPGAPPPPGSGLPYSASAALPLQAGREMAVTALVRLV